MAHEVAFIGKTDEKLKHSAKVQDDLGATFHFNLPTPLTLKNPLDVELNGTPTTNITTSAARNPETLIALDNQNILASFSNYYQFEDDKLAQKAVVGPGVVAIMGMHDGKLKTLARLVLPYKNPRYFLLKDKEQVWVVCSGAFANVGNANMTSSDAGILRLKNR